MTAVFLFGTLRHAPFLEIVLDDPRVAARTRPARLADQSVFRAGSGDLPVLASAPGLMADGVVLTDVSPKDLARLNFYESGYGYALVDCVVDTDEGPLAAQVYRPFEEPAHSGRPWSLDAWVGRWGAMTLIVAREAMGLMGRISPEQLALAMPSMRRRAWGQILLADAVPGGQGFTRQDVTLIEERQPYSGFFSFQELDLSHPQFRGGMGPIITRGVLGTGPAIMVLPYDPVRDHVLLVEQFRTGPYAAGDRAPWFLEPIAGMIDAGELPEDTARREAKEEAGVTLGRLIPLGASYPSPGLSMEIHHYFVGLCDLPEGSDGFGGVADEHEDIKSHLMRADDLFQMRREGDIRITPLFTLALWLEMNRGTLPASG